MANQLESAIEHIVNKAVSDIAQAVRSNIAEEVNRILGHVPGAKAASSPAAAASPVARGRKPGRPKRGTAPDAIAAVLGLIEKKPGLRSEQLQKELGLDKKIVARSLVKLREAGKVKTTGEKRATTYSGA